jgi:hypothetical protein
MLALVVLVVALIIVEMDHVHVVPVVAVIIADRFYFY